MDLKKAASILGKASAKLVKRDTAFFQEMGRKGGGSLKGKYGDDYYKRIRRGEKPSESIQET